jgi:UDP-glucose 4-epimerase
MSKCIVFGGEGFVGAHLVNKLQGEGHEVTVFSRSENILFDGAIKRIQGDFMNRSEVDEAVRGQEYVFHFITSTNPAVSDADPFVDIEANVMPTIHLLESCVRHEVKRVVFPSSGGAIYGEAQKDLISEDDATYPISPYAIGKQTIEGYLRYFNHKYQLDYLALRISNIYGVGQHTSGRRHGVMSVFLDNIMNDQPIKIFGDGTMVRDYIYIEDLISIVVKISFKQTKHNIYNIGSGVGISVNSIIDQIENNLHLDVKKSYHDPPSTYIDKIVLNCSRSTEEFGEYSRTSIDDGLKIIHESMKH